MKPIHIKKIKIEDLAEYDGSWCKRNKDGFCDDFTMADLKELLSQQKEEIKKVVWGMNKVSKDAKDIIFLNDKDGKIPVPRGNNKEDVIYNSTLVNILKEIEKL